MLERNLLYLTSFSKPNITDSPVKICYLSQIISTLENLILYKGNYKESTIVSQQNFLKIKSPKIGIKLYCKILTH